MSVALVVVMFSLVARAFQERPPESDDLNMQNLNFDSLAILTGGGGHTIMFSTASDAVVVVDSKRPGLGQRIVEAAKTWTDDKPVTTLINTHAHADHVGGNTAFGNNGRPVNIVAHENAKAAMARMPEFSGPNASFLPTTTFKDRLVLSFGSDRVELYYFGRGHTNGDAIVVFPGQRLAYFGDLFPGKRVPTIDASSGGSGLAFAQTLAKAIAEVTGVTRVIPSHESPPEGRRLHSQGRGWMSWADLREYSEFIRDFVDTVKVARQAGRNVNDAAEGVRTSMAAKYLAYDMDGTKPAVQQIFEELSHSGPQ
jgi:glyoxylase-like metal-dependent hydrolase (beta-lactamase superfamily II)